MIEIKDTLVSLDIVERHFFCDLALCKGACCIEGDSGAPLESSELTELQRILPAVWDDLSPQAQEVINKQGVAYLDSESELVTSIVDGKDCVFTCYDSAGTCKCAIEKAYREGRVSFFKPISCHLYPIRVAKYGAFRALNYNKWKICKAAEVLGNKEKMPLYTFLKEPLIRKFGAEWYAELEVCAAQWAEQNRK